GFAKALLANQTENLLQRGFTQFTVNTQQSNLPSQKLYKSLGYQILENRVPVFMHTIMPS
ncbi:MAG: GNAT family N-acetyltransferase, partial [Anaerolineaceae bacterium]|nr:GNAT family N-acetyltransferase [Anaerolineaceae bacterium]